MAQVVQWRLDDPVSKFFQYTQMAAFSLAVILGGMVFFQVMQGEKSEQNTKGREIMRAVVTRVSSASVAIAGETMGAIEKGYLVLLGVAPTDTEDTARKLAEKICNLRVFEDENGKMNLNLETVGGSFLVVSQFTLFADTSSRRPGFTGAAKPDVAIPLYEAFMDHCRSRGFSVAHGEFGADMQVTSVNDGPVTILFDTEAK